MPEVYSIKIDRDTLHERLSGGLPKGCVTLIEGSDGSGKSVLSQRFAYGLLMNGYSVTYISTELTTKGFLDQMRSLNYEVLNFLISRQLLFIPVYPLIGRPLPRVDFLDRLMSARELFNSDVIIIDTFSGLAEKEVSVSKVLEAIYFFKKLAGANKTIVLTADPSHLSDEVMKHIRSTADVYILLKTSYVEGEVSRAMIIKRYSFATEFVGNVTGFRVEPQVGIIVDITMVA